MDARLQRRVQRYGWDKAVADYEAGWRTQLEPAQTLMLHMAALQPGEHVLDVACGTGLVSFRASDAVGEAGAVVGTDISGEMIETARRHEAERHIGNARFERCDAEDLKLDCDPFDAALCGLGLMYVPDPVKALGEMRRLLKPGGRAAAAVWGARAKCGWAEIFPITDARVASEVCPMFFHLGTADMLAHGFAEAGFSDVRSERLEVTLTYATADEALGAAFRGGPVALAYNRFDDATQQAVHAEYLGSIAAYKNGEGYEIPGEFVAVAGVNPQD
jgi:ubiquinone/menaquinone biosynthesis C-methylase UbiE